ncbi:hypothetical protein GCM10009630_10650 [Kribbella jejuensis]|uniref:Uncharacterized protein n=1 Tax=Kribbella jejuensis TaxID=236068 RepID=A0A542EA37_9ACTN|nr:hypothetical protein [Kribbella jejuensis]TQJ12192.1 hypothetical protein FB475_5122 [Kribbella jejuensis]
MCSSGLAAPTTGDRFRQAVLDLDSVRHFLEAPYELTARDWQEAYDGLAHVVVAADRLAETLATRCSSIEHTADIAAAHDLLAQTNRRLSGLGE